ncbi:MULTISPECIES: 3-phosphoshikimate 1-carboxyvinyltransferase [Sphingobacterium]|uniref:3-phosphoshikimate 1-carboxyvinyltransferase n=1 Tax=Sphingobacterium TaxID=28453 RepID=UPI0013DA0E69|nr:MULTISPECIES: 3-phosphoshikimate 1-carboxyvinyltransferase [unclassified Sphingobacterium]
MEQPSIKLSHPTREISGLVQLTGSKSESNRALIIQAISAGKVTIQNLSNADDTLLLTKAIKKAHENAANGVKTIDIGPAGTAMRFLTSYLNLLQGEFILTGTSRMQQRPIGILVNALNSIGTEIQYAQNEGYPPLRIHGPLIQSKKSVTIKGDVSSQYVSSLLLIASALEKGLTLEIEGELTSLPYVTMTLDMLSEVGIKHLWIENSIQIQAQQALESTLYIEPDWSAASYWYAIVALSRTGSIRLPGLKKNSLQGDIAIADIMTHFGVKTTFEADGIFLEKTDIVSDKTLFDFKSCPDLAQTVVVVASVLKRDISFTGLETLRIKETDRIAALQNEIAKYGARLEKDGVNYHLHSQNVADPGTIAIKTYEDHRMAMAFAPLALVFNNIIIEEPQVVEKSYPTFWEDLQNQGFFTS